MNECQVGTLGYRELPTNWRWARLGEVCEINPRRPSGFIRPDDAPTSFIPMPAIDERTGSIARPEIRAYSEVKKGYTYFADGDVLFAKITPCMQNGKHAIASGLLDSVGFGSTEYHVIRPSNVITADWVHRYIRQPSILTAAIAHFAGAVGQQRVPPGFLANLYIPLPPLPEQKRIAPILNKQLAAVEQARAAAEAQLGAAKTLSTSYLRAIFNRQESKAWPKIEVGKICLIRGGKRLPAGSDFSVGPTPYPYIRVVDFQNGGVRTDNLKYIDKTTHEEIARYIIRREDVYISIAGSIGQVGIIPDELDGAQLTENAARFVIKDVETLNRDFLARYLQSPNGQQHIKSRTNTVGQPKLALERIATIEIPTPPLKEQNRITAILQDQFIVSDRARKIFQDEIEAINKLPAALLRRVFNGEI